MRIYSSKRWVALRRKILERDGYRCAHCGEPGFEVDHVTPIRAGGAVWDEGNLQVLCKGDHSTKTRTERLPPIPGRAAWVRLVEELEGCGETR